MSWEAPTTDGQTTDTPTTGDTAADTGTETGDTGAGARAQTCDTAEDCAPQDYACNDGFCDYIGEPPACDKTKCPTGECAEVDGVELCTFPCTDGGTECDLLMWECTGMNDAGGMICEAPPSPPCGGAAEGEPCGTKGAQSGVCTDGVCTCSDNTQCPIEGQACRM